MLDYNEPWIQGWKDEDGLPCFEWHGDGMVARVTHELLLLAGIVDRRPGRAFWMGALHLTIVDECFETRTYAVAWAGPFSALIYSWRKVQRFALIVYCRLIRTAEVWNLAKVPNYVVPSYRDLNLVRYLLRIKARDEGKVIE